MRDVSTRPLGEVERITITALIGARARVAKTMTFIVAFLDAGFCFRIWAGSKRSNQISTIAICIGVTAALAWIVWYFGWGLVRSMRQDLENGMKATITGKIERILRANNAYGETVTTVDIESERYLTRARIFDGAKEGDTMSIEYLPLSKVALRATPAGE